MKRKVLAFTFILLCFIPFILEENSNKKELVFAQEDEKIGELKKQIEEYEQKLLEARSRAKTLSSQISYMDTQIKLTGLRIQETLGEIEKLEVEITALSGKIGRLEESLTTVSKILLNRIVTTYKTGRIPTLYFLFSSDGFSDLFLRAKYIKMAQAHDKKLMIQMETTKANFAAQKDLQEEKKEEQEILKKKLEVQEKTLRQEPVWAGKYGHFPFYPPV